MVEARNNQGETYYALRPGSIMEGKGFRVVSYPIPMHLSRNAPPTPVRSQESSPSQVQETRHIPEELFDPANHKTLQVVLYKPGLDDGLGHRVSRFVSRIRQGRQPSNA